MDNRDHPSRQPRWIEKPLDSCCGCCSLKTGSIVTGVGTMILAACTLVYVFFTKEKITNILLDLPPEWVKIILILNLFMTILISGVLVLAVLKENTFLMTPWVMLGIMLIICLIISVIFTAFDYIFKKHILIGIIILIVGEAIALLYLYMWAVVYSFYQELRFEMKRLPYYRPPYRRGTNN